jgi:hypothetical protein
VRTPSDPTRLAIVLPLFLGSLIERTFNSRIICPEREFGLRPRVDVGFKPTPVSDSSKASLSADPIYGIFPNGASITRPVVAVLFEQNDEWQTQHRYMQVEAFSQIDAAQTNPNLSIQTQAA